MMITEKDIQTALLARGFDPKGIDGEFGQNTFKAIMAALEKLPVKTAAVPISKFDATSAKRMAAAHPLLQKLLTAARQKIAFTILESQRGKAAQEKAFNAGNSKAHFGQSAHNWSPAIAVDIAPIPLDWNKREPFIALSKVILPLAKEMKIPIRWGGDWNGNGILTDEKLSDLPHYELHPWREFAKDCKPYKG
jgi:predicted DNA-binding protein (UPF0251 family)